MIIAVSLAAAYAVGVEPRRVALLAAAVYFPLAAAAVAGWVAWKSRPSDGNRPSLFCEAVAAELRAGSAMRDSLAVAAISVGAQTPALRDPHAFGIAEIANAIGDEFPAIGEELRLTVVNAYRTGGRSADLFDEIGSLAVAQSEIEREVRMATAPGRATAMLLVGAPMAYLVSRAGSGGLARMVQSGQQRFVVVLGLGMFLVGAAIAAIVVFRASR